MNLLDSSTQTRLNRFLTHFGWIPVSVVHLGLRLWLIPHSEEVFGKYQQFALLLSQGKLLGDDAAPPSPLYLLLHWILQPTGVAFLQAVLAILVIRSVFNVGSFILGTSFGLMASLMLALAQPFLIYETVFEPDFALMAFLFLGLERILLAKSSLTAAILLGLSAALRPVVLPVAFLLCAIQSFRKRTFISFISLIVFALTVILPLGIIMIKSKTQLTAFMSNGLVLHVGNQPAANGFEAIIPFQLKQYEFQTAPKQSLPDYEHVLFKQFAEAATHQKLRAAEAQRYWRSFVMNWIHRYPKAAIQLFLKKIIFSLVWPDSTDVKQARIIEYNWHTSWFPINPRVLFPLAFIGCFGFVAATRKSYWIVAPWLGLIILISIFYPSNRYLVVLLPFVCLLAAFPMGCLISLIKGKKVHLGTMAMGALITACVLRLPFVVQNRISNDRIISAAYQWQNIQSAMAKGQLAQAGKVYLMAQGIFPFGHWINPTPLIPTDSKDLAKQIVLQNDDSKAPASFAAALLEQSGQCESLVKLVNDSPDSLYVTNLYSHTFDPRLAAARCSADAKNWTLARALVDKSLLYLPGNLEALSFRSALALRLNQTDLAKQTLSEIFSLHEPVSANAALSKHYRLLGLNELALESISRALAMVPDSGLLLFEHSLVLADLNRGTESVTSFNRSIDAYPQFNYPVSNLVAFYRTVNKTLPRDSQVALAFVRVLARSGNYAEALALARQWAHFNDPARGNIFSKIVQTLENIN